MNRGQAPQRPPNLGPTQPQSMSNAFRNPYSTSGYGMQIPRQVPGVLQGYPGSGVPTHSLQTRQQQQQQQGMGGPSPSMFGGRSNLGGFPFGMGVIQHQQQQQQSGTTQGQQSSSASLLAHLQHPSSAAQQQQNSTQLSQQQHQPNSQSASPQPPIQQSHPHSHSQPFQSQDTASNAPSSTTNAQETGLDPNDFPALGSGPNGTTTGQSSGTGQTPVLPPNLPSSYASQAGTGNPLTSVATAGSTGGAPGLSNNTSTRDFGPEDFPALGGPPQHGHIGINGYPSERSRMGGLFGADDSRQKLSVKTAGQWSASPNPPNANASTTANSTTGESTPFSTTLLTNGTSAVTSATLQTSGPNSLGGIPPLSSSIFGNGTNPLSLAAAVATAGAGQGTISAPTGHAQALGQNSNANTNANATTNADQPNSSTTANGPNGIPQTPAQQVLMSPADRWGLLGLLALIRSTDAEATLLGIGTDLGTMGLDMQTQGNLYSTFITPWSDSSAAHLVEPDFNLPACYNVQPATLTPAKANAFSDETLFFMFYAHPKDMAQELAAQELWNRNWRYHKELRIWLTKETGTSPSQKSIGGETGVFTVWDSENWEKTKRRLQVAYSDLEEKMNPVFGSANGASGLQQTPGQGQGQGAIQGIPSQRGGDSATPVATPGGMPVSRFADMGMRVGA